MTKPILYHKSTCTTCRKAKSFLAELGAQIEERDLGKQPLTAAELTALIGADDIIPYLNPKNEVYRAKHFKQTPPAKAEAIQLMAKEPNLIKRPLLVKGAQRVFGFDADAMKKLLK